MSSRSPREERGHEYAWGLSRQVRMVNLQHLRHGQQAPDQAQHRRVNLDRCRSPPSAALSIDPDDSPFSRRRCQERLSAETPGERAKSVAVHTARIALHGGPRLPALRQRLAQFSDSQGRPARARSVPAPAVVEGSRRSLTVSSPLAPRLPAARAYSAARSSADTIEEANDRARRAAETCRYLPASRRNRRAIAPSSQPVHTAPGGTNDLHRSSGMQPVRAASRLASAPIVQLAACANATSARPERGL